MTTNFYTNNSFEEELNVGWNIEDGIFEDNGHQVILTHSQAIQNIQSITGFNHVVESTNATNYFKVEFAYSVDNIVFTTYSDISNISQIPSNVNTWIQIRYTYVSDETLVAELKNFEFVGTRFVASIFQPMTIAPNSNVSFTNSDTYKVFNMTGFNLFIADGDENALNVYFRYTQTQGRHWTDWVRLTNENLAASRFERLKFVNFQFGFSNTSAAPISIFDLELIGEFQNITADYKTTARLGIKSQCDPTIKPSPCSLDEFNNSATSCTPCSQALTPWNANIDECNSCGLDGVVNLNDRGVLASQISTYEMLNDYIQAKNSWKIKYILTDTDKKGTDYVLHEHTIKNMILMKDFNIIVPNNQFPVENANFNGLDFDLIQSFEVHIMKNTFKKMFGVEFRPSEADGIYFCDLNQLWEIEQMFPHRGLMNAEVYYRVLLKKWNDKSGRKVAKTADGQQIGNFLGEIKSFSSLDQILDIGVNDQIKQNTKDKDSLSVSNPNQQNTDTTIMTLIKNTHAKVAYHMEDIWNASLTISKSQYKMPIKSEGLKLIEYNYKDNIIGKADNRAISFWFKTEDYQPEQDYTIFSNYDYASELGYRVNIFDGLLTVTINSVSYNLPIAQMANNKWYAMMINIDQIREKVELAVYSRQNEDGYLLNDSQLVLFGKKEYDYVPQSFTINGEMFIGGCNPMVPGPNKKSWFMTNLTVWNQPLPKGAKRNTLLNQYMVTDSHLTILVDSCDKPLVLPVYGNI